MNRIFFTFLLSIFFYHLSAQQVLVLDKSTHLPIANVIIFNDQKTIKVETNKNGKADLSAFAKLDIITFSHLAYVELEVLKRQLKSVNFKVYLRDKSLLLPEVILSASKRSELRKRIAEQVEVFNSKELKQLAPQTSADVLADIPGIEVQKSQFGGGSPVLRGMEANRVLLVVDGVRMNNAIYRRGHLQNAITVSPLLLDHVEVFFGPNSVIYGSDALGGVIHFYTKQARTSLINSISNSILTRYNSSNNEFTSQFTNDLRFKKWGSFTSVSHSKFGDLTIGKHQPNGFTNWGKVFEYSNNSTHFYNPVPVVNENPFLLKNTGYSQTDVLQKFYVPLTKKTKLSTNFQYSTSSNIPRFDKLTELKNGSLKFAEWYYGPQKRLLFSSQLHLMPTKDWLDSGTITFAYQDIDESRINRKFSSLERKYRNENVKVVSLNADFFVPLSTKDKRQLSYGFELAHNKVNSKAISKTIQLNGSNIVGFTDFSPIQSRYPDGGSTYMSSAFYLDFRQNISKKSTLNTGVRFSHTNLKAKWIDQSIIKLPKSNINLNNTAITGTIGYVFRPTENWQLNAVLSSGFRSPNIDDIGKIREKNNQVTVPNINLKPEYVYNTEFSFLKYFRNKNYVVGLTSYYTLLRHYITRETFSLNGSNTILYDDEIVNTVANVNKKNAYIVGGTFSFRGQLNTYFFLKASATYTKGKTYDTEEPLSSIPPFFGNIKLKYQKKKLNVVIYYKFNFKKAADNYNTIEGIDNLNQTPFNPITNRYYGTPSWSIINISGMYNLTKDIEITINIHNLLDYQYKPFASGISASGRGFSITSIFKI